MHPQPNKLFQIHQNQLIFRLQVVTTLFKIFRQPFHICVSKVYLYLTRQYNLILLLCATKLVLSTKIILNYTFITKYDINAKLKELLQQSHSPLLTPYMYISRSKSVFLKGKLHYTDTPRSKRKLHQKLMRNIDIPLSKNVLSEKN